MSSIGWTTSTVTPISRRPARSCIVQPGLAEATTAAPVDDDRLGLLAHQAPGHLRLGDVVDPRGAAASVAVRDLHELEVPDRTEELARLSMDALRAERVAGVVVGDDGSLREGACVDAEPLLVRGTPSRREREGLRPRRGRRSRPCARRIPPRSRRRGPRPRTPPRSSSRASAPCRGARCGRPAHRSTSARAGRRRASRSSPAPGSSRRSPAGTTGPGRTPTAGRPFP